MAQHHRHNQKHAKTDQRQPQTNVPTQRSSGFLNALRGVRLHARSTGLSRLQTRTQGLGAVCRSPHQALTHQLITAGDQRREALIQGLQFVFD